MEDIQPSPLFLRIPFCYWSAVNIQFLHFMFFFDWSFSRSHICRSLDNETFKLNQRLAHSTAEQRRTALYSCEASPSL